MQSLILGEYVRVLAGGKTYLGKVRRADSLGLRLEVHSENGHSVCHGKAKGLRDVFLPWTLAPTVECGSWRDGSVEGMDCGCDADNVVNLMIAVGEG